MDEGTKLNPNYTESYAPSDEVGFDEEHIVGRGCLQVKKTDVKQRPALFTQGSPLGQMPRQNEFFGQRVLIRTQGADKNKSKVGPNASNVSYMNTTNHVESTVFSSMTAGQKYNSVYAQGNIKMTNESFVSQTETNTNGIQTPGAHGQLTPGAHG